VIALVCAQLANGQQINVLLLEEETAELTSKRSMHDKLVLWARRTTGIILSITLQAVAGYGIVQLTFTSSKLQESITQGSIAFLAPVASSIVRKHWLLPFPFMVPLFH
jgi:hypothetical protein